MRENQLTLARRLILRDRQTVARVMTGSLDEFDQLDDKTTALLHLVGTVSAPSDFASEWVVEQALAAGATDEEILYAVLLVAPIVGAARLGVVLPHVLETLDLEVMED